MGGCVSKKKDNENLNPTEENNKKDEETTNNKIRHKIADIVRLPGNNSNS